MLKYIDSFKNQLIEIISLNTIGRRMEEMDLKHFLRSMIFICGILSFMTFIYGQENNTESVTDIDGNTYKTVKIGNQIWMAENLKVTHYRNGDPIPNVSEYKEWPKLVTGAYCAYQNDESHESDTYGYLYNWYAVTDERNLAPEGWRVASFDDWIELLHQVGFTNSGGKLKKSGLSHWGKPNTGATNEVGFSAFPGGYRSDWGGCMFKGAGAYFWTTRALNDVEAHRVALYKFNSDTEIREMNKLYGFSVRCVKDNTLGSDLILKGLDALGQDDLDYKTKIAIKIADKWLALADQGAYSECWKIASKELQNAYPKDKFESLMTGIRQELGEVKFREWPPLVEYSSVSGAEYYTVSYYSSFNNEKEEIIEYVTFILEWDESHIIG